MHRKVAGGKRKIGRVRPDRFLLFAERSPEGTLRVPMATKAIIDNASQEFQRHRLFCAVISADTKIINLP